MSECEGKMFTAGVDNKRARQREEKRLSDCDQNGNLIVYRTRRQAAMKDWIKRLSREIQAVINTWSYLWNNRRRICWTVAVSAEVNMVSI